jgi:hypothetical protein
MHDATHDPTPIHRDLEGLLLALDGVARPARYHPEGDTLFQSLQVFELARRERADRVMRAAALLHDVGTAEDGATHHRVGADTSRGWSARAWCGWSVTTSNSCASHA